MAIIVVGVDVGINGGLVAMSEDRTVVGTVMPIIQGCAKGTKSKIAIQEVSKWIDLAKQQLDKAGSCSVVVCIEAQRPMPGQGVTSMFHLGESFGLLQAIPLLRGWRLTVVQPQRWKKGILEGTAKDKAAAIQWCLANHPTLDLNVGIRKVIHHDGMADACCIAQYCMNQELGKP